MLILSLLSPFYIVEGCLLKDQFNPQLKMGLSISINITKIIPHRCPQQPNSMLLLDSVQLTIIIKHHSILNQVESITLYHGGLSWRNQIPFLGFLNLISMYLLIQSTQIIQCWSYMFRIDLLELANLLEACSWRMPICLLSAIINYLLLFFQG